jgi:hypothetical protein
MTAFRKILVRALWCGLPTADMCGPQTDPCHRSELMNSAIQYHGLDFKSPGSKFGVCSSTLSLPAKLSVSAT